MHLLIIQELAISHWGHSSVPLQIVLTLADIFSAILDSGNLAVPAAIEFHWVVAEARG
jgi:hypothetical protein